MFLNGYIKIKEIRATMGANSDLYNKMTQELRQNRTLAGYYAGNVFAPYTFTEKDWFMFCLEYGEIIGDVIHV